MADAMRGAQVLDEIARSKVERTANAISIASPAINGCDFIKSFRAPDFLFDGVLTRGAVVAMTGHTGSGKTGLAVPMAACCATGRALAGRDWQAGRVVYLAAENAVDVQARLVAVAQEYHIEPEALRESLFVLPGARGVTIAGAQVRELCDAIGEAALVVVDTSAATYEGDDENSNVEMQRHAERLRELTLLPGRPTVLVLTHPRLGAQRDNLVPRGGSAMIAALDANLTLWRGDDDSIHLHYTKLRGPPFDPIVFDLHRVELAGHADSRGRPVTAGIAVPSGDRDVELARRAEHVDADNLVLRLIEVHGYDSMSKLAARAHWIDPAGRPAKWKAQRSIERLEADHLVERFRDGYRLTKAGERELGRLGGLG